MSLSLALGLFLQVGGGAPVIIDRARVDPRAEIGFHALANPDTVYVGDAVTYELGVFIPDEVRSRLRKNPEFIPAELRSVLAYDLRGPRATPNVVRDGRNYEVHVFRRALFPVAPGTIVVPPAKLTYAIPAGSSFFSREESRILQSETVRFVAIAPPTAGRPANWNGAVGDLRLVVSVTAGKTRVGDPFVVTARVIGEANVNLLPRPNFSLPWASVVPSAERVLVDTMASTVRGSKEFDWLVTPNVEGREDIPSIEYAYFDPVARAYRVARSQPSQLTIGEGTLAAVDSAAATAGRRPNIPLSDWSGPSHDSPDRSLWFWIIAALVPIPALARYVRERPRYRAPDSPSAALHALSASGATDAPPIRRALHDALKARLGAHSIPWADPPGIVKALRRHGVTPETIRIAQALFTEIDAAAYASHEGPVRDGARRALELFDRIDDEARGVRSAKRFKKRGAAAALIFIAATSAIALDAQSGMSPVALFGRAVRAYTDGNPGPAASDFFEAARAEPTASTAWRNAGTASWIANDTARAVVGWQHALRLNPLDDGARDLLAHVGADAGAGTDVVWPIPRRLPAWFAIVLWVGGWIAVWRMKDRRIASGVVAAAAVLGVTAQVHHARLTDSRVVVMSRPAPLRSLPALGAEAGAVPLTGELLKVLERRGVWVLVLAAGDREGWIDAARVLDLNGKPLRD